MRQCVTDPSRDTGAGEWGPEKQIDADDQRTPTPITHAEQVVRCVISALAEGWLRRRMGRIPESRGSTEVA